MSATATHMPGAVATSVILSPALVAGAPATIDTISATSLQIGGVTATSIKLGPVGKALTLGTGTGNVTIDQNLTVTGTLTAGSIAGGLSQGTPVTITGANANALDVGPSGQTNPILRIDTSVTNAAVGLLVQGQAAGAGVNLSVVSPNASDGLKIDAKGAGTVTIGSVSTGATIFGVTSLQMSANNPVFQATGTGSWTFVPPATGGFAFQNNAANQNNLLISDAGLVTVRNGLTVTAGNIGIGAAALGGNAVWTNALITSGPIQRGFFMNQTYTSGGTTSGASFQSNPVLTNSVFTMGSLYHFYGAVPVLGAGSAITTQYGLYLENLTQAGTNYGLYTNAGPNSLGDSLTVRTGGLTVTAGGLTVSAGGAAITGNLTGLTSVSASSGSASPAASFTTSAATASAILTDIGTNGPGLKLVSAGTNPNKTIRVNSGSGNLEIVNSAYTNVIFTLDDAGNLLLADPANLVLGATTGTKIGTATTQKLSFWGATPIVRPSAVGSATGYAAGPTAATFHSDDTYTGNVGATAYTLNGIVAALKNVGLLTP